MRGAARSIVVLNFLQQVPCSELHPKTISKVSKRNVQGTDLSVELAADPVSDALSQCTEGHCLACASSA